MKIHPIILLIFITSTCLNCGGSSTKKDIHSDTKKPMQTTVKDIHSFAKADEVVMTDLFLDIETDFDNKIIKGKATVGYEIKKKGIEKLYLDTKDLKIQKVTIGKEEKETKYELGKENRILGQALVININDKSEQVHIYYETSPKAEALQWLSPQQTTDKKEPFLFTQSQAILARSWVPCQDSPGIRFTYSAKVKVPKDLLAVMSAKNPTKKSDTGIYEFEMPQPIPAYLLALTVGDIEFVEIGKQTGVYAEPSMLKASKYEFADLQKMLEAAEKLYGKYRWGRYDLIVLPASFPFGGMENPRLTFATPTIIAGDRSLTTLVAHELAHSWSGNLVTNATWNDFWLNEGFTMYFERRIMEELYGKDYAKMLEYLGYQELVNSLEKDFEKDSEDTHLKLDLSNRNPDDGVTNIAYEKGYFFIRTIEEAVGRKNLDEFLENYFDKFAFKTMTTEAFLDYLTEKLPASKKVDFQAWVYGPGLPENHPEVKSSRFEKVDEVLTAWKNGEKPSSFKDKTREWSSHEWLYFLRGLDKNMSQEQLQALDASFGFTNSGNSEILAAWFVHTLQNDYEKAYLAVEKFLMRVGRRKFLVPIYTAMTKGTKGKTRALAIYKKARPNYHFVSVATLDKMLGYEG